MDNEKYFANLMTKLLEADSWETLDEDAYEISHRDSRVVVGFKFRFPLRFRVTVREQFGYRLDFNFGYRKNKTIFKQIKSIIAAESDKDAARLFQRLNVEVINPPPRVVFPMQEDWAAAAAIGGQQMAFPQAALAQQQNQSWNAAFGHLGAPIVQNEVNI